MPSDGILDLRIAESNKSVCKSSPVGTSGEATCGRFSIAPHLSLCGEGNPAGRAASLPDSMARGPVFDCSSSSSQRGATSSLASHVSVPFDAVRGVSLGVYVLAGLAWSAAFLLCVFEWSEISDGIKRDGIRLWVAPGGGGGERANPAPVVEMRRVRSVGDYGFSRRRAVLQ